MARLVDVIEQMIKEMVDENDGTATICRSQLAEQANCVPSQITYVLSTRFSGGSGYIVESRRGGGGYIKITRINYNTKQQILMHIINSVGDPISEQSAKAIIINLNHREMLTADKAKIMLAAINENCYKAVPPECRRAIRASVLKQMLIAAR